MRCHVFNISVASTVSFRLLDFVKLITRGVIYHPLPSYASHEPFVIAIAGRNYSKLSLLRVRSPLRFQHFVGFLSRKYTINVNTHVSKILSRFTCHKDVSIFFLVVVGFGNLYLFHLFSHRSHTKNCCFY